MIKKELEMLLKGYNKQIKSNEENLNIIIQILDASADGMLISDRDGKVLYINNAYTKTTGLGEEDLLNKNLRDGLDQKLFNFSASLYVLENKKSITLIHKYVSGKEALTTANPIYDNDRNIIGVICNTRSVAELVKLREEVEEHKKTEIKYSNELKVLRNQQINEDEIVSKNLNMQNIIEVATKAAEFDSTIMISGETGTGKEVLSKYIHRTSSRKEGPFIKVNCAAIPEEIFESELFGYEAGAFTGASQKGKIGMFELANEGTILLDEVGELPLNMQSKLLRVLQEREVYRVGGNKPIKIDIRVISATNKDLKYESEIGNFREDLYFRLNVMPIKIPSLKDRREDINQFIDLFLRKLNKKYKKTVTINNMVVDVLNNYNYPGNVRELQNIIEYLFITAQNDEITIEQLPTRIISNHIVSTCSSNYNNSNLNEILDIFEKSIIELELKKHSSIRKTAKSLGINASTLSRKLKKHNISDVQFGKS